MKIETELVGILNITPDSFSDGDRYSQSDQAAARVQELFNQGASLVDIGAESTRPGATPLTPEEEFARLEPVLDSLHVYNGQISIDTYHPETVRQVARRIGNFIINDVTGFNSPEMIEVAAYLGLRCIVSHLPANFGQDIQTAHKMKPVANVWRVKEELVGRRRAMIQAGISPGSIILDPGIGFGKQMDLNRQLLRFAEQVRDADVMIGYSNKRFLYPDRNYDDPEPNLVAGRIAIESGAKYLRVHDVVAHRQLLDEMRSQQASS